MKNEKQIKCTSPRIPACPNMATKVLLNRKEGFILGYNCDSCIEPLIKEKVDSSGEKVLPDYAAKDIK